MIDFALIRTRAARRRRAESTAPRQVPEHRPPLSVPASRLLLTYTTEVTCRALTAFGFLPVLGLRYTVVANLVPRSRK